MTFRQCCSPARRRACSPQGSSQGFLFLLTLFLLFSRTTENPGVTLPWKQCLDSGTETHADKHHGAGAGEPRVQCKRVSPPSLSTTRETQSPSCRSPSEDKDIPPSGRSTHQPKRLRVLWKNWETFERNSCYFVKDSLFQKKQNEWLRQNKDIKQNLKTCPQSSN